MIELPKASHEQLISRWEVDSTGEGIVCLVSKLSAILQDVIEKCLFLVVRR